MTLSIDRFLLAADVGIRAAVMFITYKIVLDSGYGSELAYWSICLSIIGFSRVFDVFGLVGFRTEITRNLEAFKLTGAWLHFFLMITWITLLHFALYCIVILYPKAIENFLDFSLGQVPHNMIYFLLTCHLFLTFMTLVNYFFDALGFTIVVVKISLINTLLCVFPGLYFSIQYGFQGFVWYKLLEVIVFFGISIGYLYFNRKSFFSGVWCFRKAISFFFNAIKLSVYACPLNISNNSWDPMLRLHSLSLFGVEGVNVYDLCSRLGNLLRTLVSAPIRLEYHRIAISRIDSKFIEKYFNLYKRYNYFVALIFAVGFFGSYFGLKLAFNFESSLLIFILFITLLFASVEVTSESSRMFGMVVGDFWQIAKFRLIPLLCLAVLAIPVMSDFSGLNGVVGSILLLALMVGVYGLRSLAQWRKDVDIWSFILSPLVVYGSLVLCLILTLFIR